MMALLWIIPALALGLWFGGPAMILVIISLIVARIILYFIDHKKGRL